MKTVRQDAWSADDDLYLAEVVLRNIREGGTQLRAFEEVGEKLGRTAAACGFRWNSFVRKQYDAAIQIAKAQRYKQKRMKLNRYRNDEETPSAVHETAPQAATSQEISFDHVIRFLKESKGSYDELSRRYAQLEKEHRRVTQELESLKSENEILNRSYTSDKANLDVLNHDYQTLLQILDRARKMQVLVDQDDKPKPVFKMDANGNLERIK